MTKRRKLTRLQRVKIYDAAGGTCCLCRLPIDAERGERWVIEHVKPLWQGGADDSTNMKPAHYQCAIDKTAGEAPVKAKGDRVRAKHLGVRKPGRPMPGSKASGIRRRMSGKVERWIHANDHARGRGND